MTKTLGLCATAAFLVLATIDEASAQENAVDAKQVAEHCHQVASNCQLSNVTNDRRLDLVPQSRLAWSKNTYEDVYGNVFIWTDSGVPAAVASIYQFVRPKDDLDGEFHSLSTDPIIARVGSRALWKPKKGGLSYRPIGKSISVSERPSVRSAQMRAIARRFRAERENENGETTQLRFLTTPVYKYNNDQNGVLSGAMYTFVDQTDPEVWLIIEAYGASDGTRSWRYAIARMNTQKLRAFYEDQLVFEVAPITRFDDTSAPYVIFQRLQDDVAFGLQ